MSADLANAIEQAWEARDGVTPASGDVREIVEAVSTDMDEDPAYDDMLLGRPTFAGVESVSGEAVVVRITAKAAPDEQIAVARTIRERMKLAFDRAGITVPVLMRPMQGPGGTSGTPRPTP